MSVLVLAYFEMATGCQSNNSNFSIIDGESSQPKSTEDIYAYRSHSTAKREVLCGGIQALDYSFRRQSSCEDLHEMK